jgi:2-iminobutanoate/2-iminopropanoate deaminase
MNRTNRLLIFFFALSTAATFASDIPKRPFHLNEKVEKEIGYAQAVRIGDTLYISGSVGAGEMPAAMRESYDELKQTLAAHGLDFKNVVKENLYTTDLDAVKANAAVRKQYYGTECPAATWVQVQRLYSPKFVIEVELVAVFPK